MVPIRVGLCTPQGASHCPGPWSGPQKEGRKPFYANPVSSSSQRQARHSGEHRSSELPSLLSAPGEATWYGTVSSWFDLSLPTPRHMAPGSIEQQGIFFLTLEKSTFIFPRMSVYVHRPLSTSQNVRHLHYKTIIVRIS